MKWNNFFPRSGKTVFFILWLCGLAGGASLAVRAEGDPEMERYLSLSLEELLQVRLTSSTATGSKLSLPLTPAVISVITAEDIEAAGFTNLDQALESVVGVHVTESPEFLNSLYSIRGIHTNVNAEVQILLDGVPITTFYNSGRLYKFHFPLKNVARIEVIRGPGSALEGADAFAGVINIVSKHATDYAKLETGVGGGSFDSQSAWLMHGGNWVGWDTAFSAEWNQSRGDRQRIITGDLQANLDRRAGTRASITPGPLETGYNTLNLQLNVARYNWNSRLWYWGQRNAGNGAGFAQALDNRDHSDASYLLGELKYRNLTFRDHWELHGGLYFLRSQLDAEGTVFPPGAILPVDNEGNLIFGGGRPAGSVLFSEGLRNHIGFTEDRLGLKLSTFYTGWKKHRVRLALGTKHYRISPYEWRNYGAGITTPHVPFSIQDGTLYNFDDQITRDAENRRKVYSISLQDEWRVTENWDVTARLRYDSYSDFGTTLNPRLALIWQVTPDLSSKLLYGRAFRPPSYVEQFFVTSPSALGNPDLDPETVDTVEWAWDYRLANNKKLVLSLYRYRIQDQIKYLPDPESQGGKNIARNTEGQTGSGGELSGSWRLNSQWNFRANYSYQEAEYREDGERVPRVPRHLLYLSAEWHFAPNWLVKPQYYRVMDIARDVEDTRPPTKNYSLLNLSLRRKNLYKNWSLSLTARNLLDRKIYHPASQWIPNDYPQPGRSLYMEIHYKM